MKLDKIYMIATKDAARRYQVAGFEEEGIVFVESDNPLDEVQRRIDTSSDARIGIFIFPEGLVSHVISQAPLAAKPGAFVLARRLAHSSMQKDGGPVYLMRGLVNGSEHLSSEKPIPLTLKLEEPIPVPSDKVGSFDEWVNAQRLSFEAAINMRRGDRQVDLIRRTYAEGTKLPSSGIVRAYLPIHDWYNAKVILSCRENLRSLPDKNARHIPSNR